MVLSPEKLKEQIEKWGGVPALAHELKVSRQAVYTWLRGERVPSLRRLSTIIEVLGCKFEDVMEERDGHDLPKK